MGDNRVSRGWMYASGTLSVLIVAQFFWWKKQAPEVLKRISY